MPWKCPACQTQIQHEGDLPELHRVYRCHVCRLELILDEQQHKLVITPFPAEVSPKRRKIDKAAS